MKYLLIITLLVLGGCNRDGQTGPKLQALGEQLTEMGRVKNKNTVVCNSRQVGAFWRTTCN